MDTKKLRRILESLAHAQRGNMGSPEEYIEMLSTDQAIKEIQELERKEDGQH